MTKNKYGSKCIVYMHVTAEPKVYWLHVFTVCYVCGIIHLTVCYFVIPGPFDILFALCSPFGQMIKPMLESMQVTPEGGHHPFQQATTSNASAGAASSNSQLGSHGATSIQSPSVERQQSTSSLSKDLNLPKFHLEKAMEIYSNFESEIHSECESDTQKLLNEFCEYLSQKEPTWSPSPKHICSFSKYTLYSAFLNVCISYHVTETDRLNIYSIYCMKLVISFGKYAF